MKILITGSSGFLGSFLVKELEKKNEIIRFDLPNNILNYKNILSFLKKNKPNLIIHSAAAKGAQKSNNYPKLFFETNFNGTLNILEAMRKCNLKKIIYISSSGFYKRSNNIILENDEIDFNNPYAYGKYLGEKIIEFYTNKYGFYALALRPNLITGKGLKQDNLIYDIIKEIKYKNIATVFGKGNHIREFIHPLDICDSIKLWIKKKKKSKFEVYNITSNRYPIIKVIKKIIKFLKNGKVVYGNKNAKVFSLRLSNKKIKKNLKWKSKKNLDYIIKDNYEAL